MSNLPLNHVLGTPAAIWREGSFKVVAIMKNRLSLYKIKCSKCNNVSKGSVYLMRTIKNNLSEYKPCQHV